MEKKEIVVKNKTEYLNLWNGLLKDWLLKRNFTGNFKIFLPEKLGDNLKIELYYDEVYSKEFVTRLSKELCTLK